MKRILVLVIAIALMGFVTGCPANMRVKSYGGSMNYNLPKGEKLVNVTWKDSNLWILTKARPENEKLETYTFKESSTYGVFQGTITFKEQ